MERPPLTEQQLDQYVATSKNIVKDDDVAMFAGEDDMLIYEHFVANGLIHADEEHRKGKERLIGELERWKTQFPIAHPARSAYEKSIRLVKKMI